MNTSSELQEICKIVQSTLEFYITFRSAGFEFGGKFDVNNHSIEVKYYSTTPYCIQMAEFHIKDKQDMQYFLATSLTSGTSEIWEIKIFTTQSFQGYPNIPKENKLWKVSNRSYTKPSEAVQTL